MRKAEGGDETCVRNTERRRLSHRNEDAISKRVCSSCTTAIGSRRRYVVYFAIALKERYFVHFAIAPKERYVVHFAIASKGRYVGHSAIAWEAPYV